MDGIFIEHDGEVCQLLPYFNTQNSSSEESFIQELQGLNSDQKINEEEWLKLYRNIKLST